MINSLSGKREREGGEGESGKGWLTQQLPRLQKEIFRVEKELANRKPGVRLAKLKQLVKSYNEALKIIFGKENAQRLVNYKVVGQTVTTFIPEPGVVPLPSVSNEGKREKRQLVQMRPKRREKDVNENEKLSFSSGIGFDSKEVGQELLTEEKLLTEAAVYQVCTSDDISRGTGYVVVVDRFNKKSFSIPFMLKNDLEFIKKTAELYFANGYDIVVVVHIADLRAGLISPKQDKTGRNTASLN